MGHGKPWQAIEPRRQTPCWPPCLPAKDGAWKERIQRRLKRRPRTNAKMDPKNACRPGKRIPCIQVPDTRPNRTSSVKEPGPRHSSPCTEELRWSSPKHAPGHESKLGMRQILHTSVWKAMYAPRRKKGMPMHCTLQRATILPAPQGLPAPWRKIPNYRLVPPSFDTPGCTLHELFALQALQWQR